MVKFKVKYVLWFFQTIWQCIVDLFKNPITCYKENLWIKNWYDLSLRVFLDDDIYFHELIKEYKNKDGKNN